VFQLDPETAWRRLALPRLLYVTGDRAGALRHYQRELALAPDNLFLIRELYFMHLAEGDAAALRNLVDKLRTAWRHRSMPTGVEELVHRTSAGIEALGGRPAALTMIVDNDVRAFDAPRTGGAATQQGRASVDLLYIYAMEYAWARRISRALDLLERALAARSLYWPATLPFGATEFPESVRRHPRYAALWKSEPRLQQLIDTRLRAVSSRQMAGVLPDGRRVNRVS
jgi:tetratricopeptide (TPR) repeat protein